MSITPRVNRLLLFVLCFVLSGLASGAYAAPARPSLTVRPLVWIPVVGTTWQWQLSGLPVDQSVQAAMYDIDAVDNEASVVASLHAKGVKRL